MEGSISQGRQPCEVHGGKLMVVGDLHLSATYEGSHISYITDCYKNMDLIVRHAEEEQPSAIIFLGDLIGVRERNIRDRQFLMRVLLFFGKLYNITKGNVFSVKGNHDIGDFSDFDLLIGLGHIKNPSYIDYYGDNNLEVRFHLVNYGEENYKLSLTNDGATNVVLGHADYYIEGVTTWYSPKSEVELKKLKNFCGVDLVFSGHIHIPSEEMLYTTLPDGESIGLFYLGSPSRTGERFDDCWYLTFEYSKESNSTDYEAKLMGLEPASEIFYPEEDYKLEVDEEKERKKEVLDEIVNEVINSRILVGDLFHQIDLLPAETEVKELAKKYLRVAMD